MMRMDCVPEDEEVRDNGFAKEKTSSSMDVFSVLLTTLEVRMSRVSLDEHMSPITSSDHNFPVLRVFGVTPSGQRACVHIHGALPYVFFRPENPHHTAFADINHLTRLLPVLQGALEDLLWARKLTMAQGRKIRRTQYLHKLTPVKKFSAYGLWSAPVWMVEVLVYDPRDINRIANLLAECPLAGVSMQTYEAHIPFELQFTTEYNVIPMNWLRVSDCRFRLPLPAPVSIAQDNYADDKCLHTQTELCSLLSSQSPPFSLASLATEDDAHLPAASPFLRSQSLGRLSVDGKHIIPMSNTQVDNLTQKVIPSANPEQTCSESNSGDIHNQILCESIFTQANVPDRLIWRGSLSNEKNSNDEMKDISGTNILSRSSSLGLAQRSQSFSSKGTEACKATRLENINSQDVARVVDELLHGINAEDFLTQQSTTNEQFSQLNQNSTLRTEVDNSAVINSFIAETEVESADALSAILTSAFHRSSTCELELDIHVSSIVNRHLTRQAFGEELWREEEVRCTRLGLPIPQREVETRKETAMKVEHSVLRDFRARLSRLVLKGRALARASQLDSHQTPAPPIMCIHPEIDNMELVELMEDDLLEVKNKFSPSTLLRVCSTLIDNLEMVNQNDYSDNNKADKSELEIPELDEDTAQSWAEAALSADRKDRISEVMNHRQWREAIRSVAEEFLSSQLTQRNVAVEEAESLVRTSQDVSALECVFGDGDGDRGIDELDEAEEAKVDVEAILSASQIDLPYPPSQDEVIDTIKENDIRIEKLTTGTVEVPVLIQNPFETSPTPPSVEGEVNLTHPIPLPKFVGSPFLSPPSHNVCTRWTTTHSGGRPPQTPVRLADAFKSSFSAQRTLGVADCPPSPPSVPPVPTSILKRAGSNENSGGRELKRRRSVTFGDLPQPSPPILHLTPPSTLQDVLSFTTTMIPVQSPVQSPVLPKLSQSGSALQLFPSSVPSQLLEDSALCLTPSFLPPKSESLTSFESLGLLANPPTALHLSSNDDALAWQNSIRQGGFLGHELRRRGVPQSFLTLPAFDFGPGLEAFGGVWFAEPPTRRTNSNEEGTEGLSTTTDSITHQLRPDVLGRRRCLIPTFHAPRLSDLRRVSFEKQNISASQGLSRVAAFTATPPQVPETKSTASAAVGAASREALVATRLVVLSMELVANSSGTTLQSNFLSTHSSSDASSSSSGSSYSNNGSVWSKSEHQPNASSDAAIAIAWSVNDIRTTSESEKVIRTGGIIAWPPTPASKISEMTAAEQRVKYAERVLADTERRILHTEQAMAQHRHVSVEDEEAYVRARQLRVSVCAELASAQEVVANLRAETYHATEKEWRRSFAAAKLGKTRRDRHSTKGILEFSDDDYTVELDFVADEESLISRFIAVVRSVDPDVLLAYETQRSSFGYLAERSTYFGIDLFRELGRTPYEPSSFRNGQYASPSLQKFLGARYQDPSVHLSSISSTNTGGQSVAEKEKRLRYFSTTSADDEDDSRPGEDPSSPTGNSTIGAVEGQIHVSGRLVFAVWEIARAEARLTQFSRSSVTANILGVRFPSFASTQVSLWLNSMARRHAGLTYLFRSTTLSFQILQKLDFFRKGSEFSRLFRITFDAVWSRGSQFRVESALLPAAKSRGFVLLTASTNQVANQAPLTALPLILEPESGFHSEPVAVLDFRSLYPSVIAAKNLCFTTLCGRLRSGGGGDASESETTGQLGVISYSEVFSAAHVSLRRPIPPCPHETLPPGDDQARPFVAPNGAVFCSPSVRRGLLPQLVDEMMQTRRLIKAALKIHKPPRGSTFYKVLDARQLAIKLLANVTYGYAAASFSGRMPCAELADAIVSTARSYLEDARDFVHVNAPLPPSSTDVSPNVSRGWGGRMIYGDTDSLFISFPGRSLRSAYQTAADIAATITSRLPPEMALISEKVYYPSLLITKKRYTGLAFESIAAVDEWEKSEGTDRLARLLAGEALFTSDDPEDVGNGDDEQKKDRNLLAEDAKPRLDIKGLEAIRRDQCRAVQRIQTRLLAALFTSRDLSAVRRLLFRTWQDIAQACEGRLSSESRHLDSLVSWQRDSFLTRSLFDPLTLSDFVFWRDVRPLPPSVHMGAAKNGQAAAGGTTGPRVVVSQGRSRRATPDPSYLSATSGSGSVLTPAAMLLAQALMCDPRSLPPRSWRIGYVIIAGAPGATLRDLVVSPDTFLRLHNQSTSNSGVHVVNGIAPRLSANYYITRALNPALDRILSLCGVRLSSWYAAWPRLRVKPRRPFQRPDLRYEILPATKSNPSTRTNGKIVLNGAPRNVKQLSIDSFVTQGECEACGMDSLPKSHLCKNCRPAPAETLATIAPRLNHAIATATALEKRCEQCSWQCTRSLQASRFFSSTSTSASRPYYMLGDDACQASDCVILQRRLAITHVLCDLSAAFSEANETLI